MTSTRPFPDRATAVGRLAAAAWSGDARLDALGGPPVPASGHAAPLPDPKRLASHAGALALLRRVRQVLDDRLAGRVTAAIDMATLPAADRALIDQWLGEGEVAARVRAVQAGDVGLQAQESVFAGVWRLRHGEVGGEGEVGEAGEAGRRMHDGVEVGPVPQGLLDAAQRDVATLPSPDGPRPADLMNAPAVLEELRDRSRTWRPGDPAHVVNLTLLPLSTGDAVYLDAQLGAGRVVILSRGYAHCRVVNTRLPRTWRVTYFNANERVILDTLEVALVPEVACAAPQDLEDSAERLDELLAWVEAS